MPMYFRNSPIALLTALALVAGCDKDSAPVDSKPANAADHWNALELAPEQSYRIRYGAKGHLDSWAELAVSPGQDATLAIHWSLLTPPQPRLSGLISAEPSVAVRNLRPALIRTPKARALLATMLDLRWQSAKSLPIREGQARTEALGGGASYRFRVGSGCQVGTRRGSLLTLDVAKRKMAEACIDPKVALPLRVETFTTAGSSEFVAELDEI